MNKVIFIILSGLFLCCTLRTYSIGIVSGSSCGDILTVDTFVRCIWDDTYPTIDTIVLAVRAYEKGNKKWLVLPKRGPVIICDKVQPIREEKSR